MIKCEAELQEAIDIQHTDVPVTFSDFLTWITRNAFQECLLLNSETWLQQNHENRFWSSVSSWTVMVIWKWMSEWCIEFIE